MPDLLCHKCRKDKHPDEFAKSGSPRGRSFNCLECQNACMNRTGNKQDKSARDKNSVKKMANYADSIINRLHLEAGDY
jgi:hypothetical protein